MLSSSRLIPLLEALTRAWSVFTSRSTKL